MLITPTLVLLGFFAVSTAFAEPFERARRSLLPRPVPPLIQQYSSVVAIGASYQDNGHPRPAPYGPTLRPPPYVGGRTSNGPVMVESLFDLSGAQSFYDFAYIGAHIDNSQTGGLVPDTKQQIANYSSQLDANAVDLGRKRTLDVYWAGINSVLAIWSDIEKTQDVPGASKRIVLAIQSVSDQITTLRSLKQGCEDHDLLLLPIPPIETSPYASYTAQGNATQISFLGQLTRQFNAGINKIYTDLKKQEKPHGPHIYTYDVVGLWRDAAMFPVKYGLKNVTSPCLDSVTGTVCAEPETYLYWDVLHPTTSFARYVAKQAWARIRP